MRGLSLVLFLVELDGLTIWSTDIGNTYLEVRTWKKVFTVIGPEFGAREGHTMVMV